MASSAGPATWSASVPSAGFRELQESHRALVSSHLLDPVPLGRGKFTYSVHSLRRARSSDECEGGKEYEPCVVKVLKPTDPSRVLREVSVLLSLPPSPLLPRLLSLGFLNATTGAPLTFSTPGDFLRAPKAEVLSLLTITTLSGGRHLLPLHLSYEAKRRPRRLRTARRTAASGATATDASNITEGSDDGDRPRKRIGRARRRQREIEGGGGGGGEGGGAEEGEGGDGRTRGKRRTRRGKRRRRRKFSASLRNSTAPDPSTEFDCYAPPYKLIHDLFSAMSLLHSCRYVHLDVKPSNLLTNSTHLLLLDFGLSTPSNSTSSHRVATLNYKPPELWQPARWTGEGVDAWACGCVVVEIVRNWWKQVSIAQSKVLCDPPAPRLQLTLPILSLSLPPSLNVLVLLTPQVAEETGNLKEADRIWFKGRGRMFPGRSPERVKKLQAKWARDGKIAWKIDESLGGQQSKLFLERCRHIIEGCLQCNLSKRITPHEVLNFDWWDEVL